MVGPHPQKNGRLLATPTHSFTNFIITNWSGGRQPALMHVYIQFTPITTLLFYLASRDYYGSLLPGRAAVAI